MNKELTVKLTNSEINSLTRLVSNRISFFRNELKKQDQLESYVNFVKNVNNIMLIYIVNFYPLKN